MRDLWQNMNPASTNYDAMQEPLTNGEVLVAWDHVARLVGAPASKPNDWLMVPAPRGPKGRGYMLIVAGVAMPKGGRERYRTEQVIRGFAEPTMQIEAGAVRLQQRSPGAILALPPVGLGAKDGEVSQIFKNCFVEICLNGSPVQSALDRQATKLNTILKALDVPCWAPDPVSPGSKCEVA